MRHSDTIATLMRVAFERCPPVPVLVATPPAYTSEENPFHVDFAVSNGRLRPIPLSRDSPRIWDPHGHLLNGLPKSTLTNVQNLVRILGAMLTTDSRHHNITAVPVAKDQASDAVMYGWVKCPGNTHRQRYILDVLTHYALSELPKHATRICVLAQKEEGSMLRVEFLKSMVSLLSGVFSLLQCVFVCPSPNQTRQPSRTHRWPTKCSVA